MSSDEEYMCLMYLEYVLVHICSHNVVEERVNNAKGCFFLITKAIAKNGTTVQQIVPLQASFKIWRSAALN
jgi:hypothetical protein